MRPATLFASLLLYAVLATSLPQPLRPRDRKSFRLPVNVQLPKSNTQLEGNRHRARALAKREPLTANLTNTAIAYTASVGVGSPPTFYNLDIDTGSSNTWIGAIQPYFLTNTSKPTGQNVSVTYGSGSFSGLEFIDQLTFGNGISFTQSIGVALNATANFLNNGFDGILGLGPTASTQGTLTPNVSETIPTVVDSLFAQGVIQHALVALSFAPVVGDDKSVNVTGEIDFGEVDTSKTNSDIVFTPLTKDPEASKHWGLDASISLGGNEIVSLTSGIVDSGTSQILLPVDAFNQYVNTTGATLNDIGLLTITKDRFLQMPSLNVSINGVQFEMIPDAQAFAQDANPSLGVDPNDILLAIGNLGDVGEGGIQFMLGYAMLERFYAVFDTENQQVGLATTPHTYDTVNVHL